MMSIKGVVAPVTSEDKVVQRVTFRQIPGMLKFWAPYRGKNGLEFIAYQKFRNGCWRTYRNNRKISEHSMESGARSTALNLLAYQRTKHNNRQITGDQTPTVS